MIGLLLLWAYFAIVLLGTRREPPSRIAPDRAVHAAASLPQDCPDQLNLSDAPSDSWRVPASRAYPGAALLVALVVAVAGLAAPAGASSRASYPHAGEDSRYSDPDPWLGRHTGHRPPCLIVGDSLVRRMLEHGLQARHPSCEITAVPGRDVGNLAWYLRDRAANRSRLRVVVVALGTNATEGWSYGDYRAAVNQLPRRTRVVFITTYRDPVAYGRATGLPLRSQAWIQSWYSKWMVAIAARRKRTCAAQWRSYAEQHPEGLVDGVHPSAAGRAAWLRLLEGKLGRGHCR